MNLKFTNSLVYHLMIFGVKDTPRSQNRILPCPAEGVTAKVGRCESDLRAFGVERSVVAALDKRYRREEPLPVLRFNFGHDSHARWVGFSVIGCDIRTCWRL